MTNGIERRLVRLERGRRAADGSAVNVVIQRIDEGEVDFDARCEVEHARLPNALHVVVRKLSAGEAA